MWKQNLRIIRTLNCLIIDYNYNFFGIDFSKVKCTDNNNNE